MFITLDLITTTTAGPTMIQEVSNQPNEEDELRNIDRSGHGRSWSEGDGLSFRLDKTSGMSDDVLQDTTACEPGAFHCARLSDKPHIPHIPYPSSGLGSAIGPPSTKVPILLFERSRFNWLWVPGETKREPINIQNTTLKSEGCNVLVRWEEEEQPTLRKCTAYNLSWYAFLFILLLQGRLAAVTTSTLHLAHWC